MTIIRVFFISCLFFGSSTSFGSEDAASIYDVPLSFVNQDGKKVNLSKLKGSKVAVTMVYTSCPHACPRIIQRLKNLQKIAKRAGEKAKYVVVTFDPAVDTAAKLKKYQKSSEETSDWYFLTGTNTNIRQLAMVLGIRYEKNPEDGSISHDNKIVVLDETGKIKKEMHGLAVESEDSL